MALATVPNGMAIDQDTEKGAAFQALTRTLVKKISEAFGDIAEDPTASALINAEVSRYMNTTKCVSEKDISHLEDRIRNLLTGGTPVRNSKVIEKQAIMSADEWAKIMAYQNQIGKIQDKKKLEERAKRADSMRKHLDRQCEEHAARKLAEAAEKLAQAEAQKQDLEAFRLAEAAKTQKRKDATERLKHDVNGQLEERKHAREMAAAIKQKEERDMTARIAYETRRQMEEEDASHRKAKSDLKDFLLSNEVNKKIKEEAKRVEAELDLRYMAEFAQQLDRQEKARQEQVDRLKKWQTQQAKIAQHTPPAKRWIDPAIIERNYKERELNMEREEKRRQSIIAEKAAKFRVALAKQIEERKSIKAKNSEVVGKDRAEMLKKVEAAKEFEAAKIAKEAAKRANFRRMLDEQMAQTKARKIVQPMSDTERRINAPLLEKIKDMQLTGEVK